MPYLLGGNRFLEKAAWSRMSNFLMPNQNFGNFSQSWWNKRLEGFERKFNKYSEER